ncbi:Pcc1-domain-containing protein [Tothia fuscella]|uniref:Pcc1-domain-containing protein n=1 Tax=Tothia fuscella TaxID=1048955 RepID=A0A9P4NW90_9PEZI|nr:Pcc1-domain-containing protein [Tothia fuscella]
MAAPEDSKSEHFPCKLTLNIPFPTPRLASIALRATSVDKELSPLVQRFFSLDSSSEFEDKTVLQVRYQATTNRMLRVAVNGFFESLKVVVQVMEDLDVDVAVDEGKESLDRVQGLNEAAVGV